MTAVQERRLRELRSRVLVRSWDHRQRRHSRGAWFRLRRVLALAKEAYAIPADEAERLIAEGHQPEPVGRELAPSRVILVVSAERVARIVSARPVEVRLSAETLAEACLALVPFEAEAGPEGRRGRTASVS